MRTSTSHQRPSCTPRDPATQRFHTWHGTRFARTTFCTLFILGIALVPRVVTAGTIYNLVDYPALQNGYDLSGTIVTNGTTGDLSGGDLILRDVIQSWSVLITKADTPSFTLSFSGTGGPGGFGLAGLLRVTQDDIELAPQSDPSGFSLGTPPGGVEPLEAAVSWQPRPAFGPPIYAAFQRPINLWFSTTTPVPTVIATTTSGVVPEPPSLAMAGLAGLCGLAYVLVRKRRSERRQGAAGQPQPTE